MIPQELRDSMHQLQLYISYPKNYEDVEKHIKETFDMLVSKLGYIETLTELCYRIYCD